MRSKRQMTTEDIPSMYESKTSEELDRDLAEITLDCEFLDAQVQSDLGSYSAAELMMAQEKISHFKRKAGAIRMELETRESKSAK